MAVNSIIHDATAQVYYVATTIAKIMALMHNVMQDKLFIILAMCSAV